MEKILRLDVGILFSFSSFTIFFRIKTVVLCPSHQNILMLVPKTIKIILPLCQEFDCTLMKNAFINIFPSLIDTIYMKILNLCPFQF